MTKAEVKGRLKELLESSEQFWKSNQKQLTMIQEKIEEGLWYANDDPCFLPKSPEPKRPEKQRFFTDDVMEVPAYFCITEITEENITNLFLPLNEQGFGPGLQVCNHRRSVCVKRKPEDPGRDSGDANP